MDDLAALVTQLDQDYLAATESLTDEQRGVVLAWQRTNREYRAIQRFVRRGLGDSTIRSQAKQLAQMIAIGRTKRPLSVWRGARSVTAAFGGPIRGQDARRRLTASGFLAVTADRQVALKEFAQPPGAGGPLLMNVQIPAGFSSLWVAGAGASKFRYQCELLLPDQTVGILSNIHYRERVPTATLRVVNH